MRLLILTQAVDLDSTSLSFFHGWIAALAPRFDSIHVVCLYEGRHALPHNVHVHSLGKERRRSRLAYLFRFFKYAWRLRNEYDAVFVHMNQEYVLLGAVLWRALGKQVYLWRNHYAGSFLTTLAGRVSSKVFYTSRHSFTARMRNAVRMPVGVDTSLYQTDTSALRHPHSVLFYARMAPSKHPEVLVQALAELKRTGVAFESSFYGSPIKDDELFAERLKQEASQLLGAQAHFHPGLPHREGPRVFSAHEIFVNLGQSGMYDKMIFEAAGCGCLVLAVSDDYRERMPAALGFDGTVHDLAEKVRALLSLSDAEKDSLKKDLRSFVDENSLPRLVERLVAELKRGH